MLSLHYILVAIMLTMMLGSIIVFVLLNTYLQKIPKLVKIFITPIIAISMGILLTNMVYAHNQKAIAIIQKEWNNGYCTKCGGSYNFVNTDYNARTTKTTYYYSCKKCGKIFTIDKHQYDKISK